MADWCAILATSYLAYKDICGLFNVVFFRDAGSGLESIAPGICKLLQNDGRVT